MINNTLKPGEAFVFDLEADGLRPTKIHCLSARDVVGENVFSTTNYDDMRKFLEKAKYLVGHAIGRFDVPVLERLLGVEIKAEIVDTLPVSMYLYPQRQSHGLESWGEEFGVPKPTIDDWHSLSVEEYIHRCEEDVKINWQLWKKLWVDLRSIYYTTAQIDKFLKYLEFKTKTARYAERNKWRVDVTWAEHILVEYDKIRTEKIEILKKAMPKVPKSATRTRPKQFYKKDGSYTANAVKWIQLCQEHGLDPVSGPDEVDVVVKYDDPNPASSDQIKDWLFSLGWKPTEFKQGANGDIPQVNLPHNKGLCPDIKRLEEDVEPRLEALAGLSVLNHRIPQIKRLLNDQENGYIFADIAGFTNTLRMKHARLVNMPKPHRPYSEGIRASLVARDGCVLVGADLSSLEDKIKQHFIWPKDKEYVLSMQRPDFDPHLTLAKLAGAVTDEDIKQYQAENDPDKRIKKIRDVYKNGNYACQYGAGVPRLVKTTGATKEVAQKIHDAYWDLNKAVLEVADEQITKQSNTGTWLWNPVSDCFYELRHHKDRFSTLVQGTASFVFDYWLGLVLNNGYWDQYLGQFHDEFILEIEDTPEERRRAEAVIRKAVKKVSDTLSFNVELGCDVQFGTKYSEIH